MHVSLPSPTLVTVCLALSYHECSVHQDGVYGVKILGYGMSGCIFGSGFITYSLIGFFGAICSLCAHRNAQMWMCFGYVSIALACAACITSPPASHFSFLSYVGHRVSPTSCCTGPRSQADLM